MDAHDDPQLRWDRAERAGTTDPDPAGALNADPDQVSPGAAMTAVSRAVKAIVSLGFVAYIYRAIGHAGEERNIRALARHLGCSHEEARRLYVGSRRYGYGAAYREVFPDARAVENASAVEDDVPAPDPREPVHR